MRESAERKLLLGLATEVTFAINPW